MPSLISLHCGYYYPLPPANHLSSFCLPSTPQAVAHESGGRWCVVCCAGGCCGQWHSVLGCKLFNFRNLKSKQFELQNYVPQLPCCLPPSSSGNTTPYWSPSSMPALGPSSHTQLAFHDDNWTPLASSPSSLNAAQMLLPHPSCSTLQQSVQHLLLNL